jgi:hypothetical protein
MSLLRRPNSNSIFLSPIFCRFRPCVPLPAKAHGLQSVGLALAVGAGQNLLAIHFCPFPAAIAAELAYPPPKKHPRTPHASDAVRF